MHFIDTHCHPHFAELAADAKGVLDRASQNDVTKMIAVGVNLVDSKKAIDFANQHQNVWAAAGTHPHDAAEFMAKPKHSSLKLLNMLSNLRTVATGEIGLDYYRLNSAREIQLTALRSQIEVGQKTELPFIFHVRDAWPDFWQVFDEYKNLKGVVHSFTGGPNQLEAALSRNLYIAINGIVTFTKDQALQIAAKQIPIDRLLLETDAPFLLPAGSNEKRCEPMHIKNIAEFLAQLRQENLETIAAATTRNAVKLFGLREAA